MLWPSPPLSREELLHRARSLDGLTVGELAGRLGQQLGSDPRRTKGAVGVLVERALGGLAGNLDLPDFPELGVELKTIPIDRRGKVCESTYVCAIDLEQLEQEEWPTSRVYRKTACVLWVPVEAAAVEATLSRRHIGSPRLWVPSAKQHAALSADWHALVGRILVGGIEELSGHDGEVLQVRPKAANSAARTPAWGPEGEWLETVPLGFYLRARFTEQVLWQGP
jgi:DNA mismatch repair protein MutH